MYFGVLTPDDVIDTDALTSAFSEADSRKIQQLAQQTVLKGDRSRKLK